MSSRSPAGFARRIAQLARKLGIPADYAVARHLQPQREAARLVVIGRADDDGKIIRLAPRAAAAWKKMAAASAGDGIVLLPLSGFRSVARQARIIRTKLAEGQTIGSILRLVAAPGFSEHHSGRAIDIGSPRQTALNARFARTNAFAWLEQHAGRFGFHLSYPRGNRHGIGYEPWHWCWRR